MTSNYREFSYLHACEYEYQCIDNKFMSMWQLVEQSKVTKQLPASTINGYPFYIAVINEVRGRIFTFLDSYTSHIHNEKYKKVINFISYMAHYCCYMILPTSFQLIPLWLSFLHSSCQ